MKFCFFAVLFFIANISYCQKQVLLQIPEKAANIFSFIPNGYDTLALATGDLNKDTVNDLAMVLFHKKENETDASNADPDSLPSRLLVILFKTGDNYILAGKSASAIMCKGCGGILGDPFQSISIRKGVLIIDHYGGSAWRWHYEHKFRFQKNDWFLIGKRSLSYWNVKNCDKLNDFAGTDFEEINFITGQYEQKKISEECKLLINKKGKKALAPLQKLVDFSIDN